MTSRFVLTLVASSLALVSLGCVTDTPNSDSVPMPTGNSELRRELLIELDERDIWYSIVDESHIEIETKDMVQVGELFEVIIRKTLPRDRSFAPVPHLLDRLTESMEGRGVTCKSVNAFDKDWLVCNSEEDLQVVYDTLDKIQTESDEN